MLAIDGNVRYSLGPPSLGRTTAVAASPDGTLFALATPTQLAICSVTGSVQQISRLPIDLRGYNGPVHLAWCPSGRAAHASAHAPQRAYRLCLTAPSVALVLEIGDDTGEKAAGWLEWLLGEEDEEEELTPDHLPEYPVRVIASITPPNSGTSFTSCAASLTHVLIGRSDGVVAAFTWGGRAVYEAELKGMGSGGYGIRSLVCTPDGALLLVAFVSGVAISASLAYVPFLHIPQGSIRVVAHAPRTGPPAHVTAASVARVDDGSFVLVLGYASGVVELHASGVPVKDTSPPPATAATAAPSAAAVAGAGIVPLTWRMVTRYHAHADAPVRGVAIRTRTLPREAVARIPYDEVKLHMSPQATVERGPFVDVCSSVCHVCVLTGSNHASLWSIVAPTRTLTLIHACVIDGMFSEAAVAEGEETGSLLAIANGGYTCLIALPHACAAAPRTPSHALVALHARVGEDEDDEPEPQQPHVARLDMCDSVRDTSAAASAAWFITADAVACMASTGNSSTGTAGSSTLTPRSEDDAAPLAWAVARGSAHYTPSNAPLLHAAVSPDGSAIVAAGTHGAAIYFLRKKSWRVFSTPTQERSVSVHACAWVSDRAVALLHGGKGATWEVHVYPRTHLDTSLRLCTQPCALPQGACPIAMTCSNSDVWLPSRTAVQCGRAHMLAVTAVHVSQPAWDDTVTRVINRSMKASASSVATDRGDGAAAVAEVIDAPHAVVCVYRVVFKSTAAATATSKDVPPFISDVTLVPSDAALVDATPLPTAAVNAAISDSGDVCDPAFIARADAHKSDGMRQVHDLTRAGDGEAVHARYGEVTIRPPAGVTMSLLAMLRLPREVADAGIASVTQLGKDLLQEGTGDVDAAVKSSPAPATAWYMLLPDFCIITRTGAVYMLHAASASMWRALAHPQAAVSAIQPRSFGSGSAATACIIHTPDAVHVYTRGCAVLGRPAALRNGSLATCTPVALDIQDHAGVHVHASALLGHLRSHAGAALFAHAGARVPAVPATVTDVQRDEAADASSYRARTRGAASRVSAPPSTSDVPVRSLPLGIRIAPAMQYLLHAALCHGIEALGTSDPLGAAVDLTRAALVSHAPLVASALRTLLHDAIEAEATARPASAGDAAVIVRMRRTTREVSEVALDAMQKRARDGSITVADINVPLASSCGSAALSVLRPLADALVVYMHKHRMPVHAVFGQPMDEGDTPGSPLSSPSSSASVYLEAVLALLRRVDMFLDVVAAVGRTIEEERLPALFPAAGAPRDLFRAALKRASALGGGVASTPVHNRASIHYLRVAAAFMLLVQEFGWRTRMPEQKGGNAALDATSRRIALSIVSENMDDAQALLETVGISQDVAAALVGSRVHQPGADAAGMASPRREADALLASPALSEALTAVSDSDPHTAAALMQIVDSAAMYCSRLRAAGEEYAMHSSTATASRKATGSTPAPTPAAQATAASTAITSNGTTPRSGGWGLLGSVAYLLGMGAGADDLARTGNGVDDGAGDGIGDVATDPTLRALRECTIELLATARCTVNRKPGGNFGIVLAPVNLVHAVKGDARGVPDDLLGLASRAGAGYADLAAVTTALEKAREQQGAWLRAQLRDCVACVGGLTQAHVTRGPELQVGDILTRVNVTTLTNVDFRTAVDALAAAPRDTELACHRVVSLPVLVVLRTILANKELAAGGL